MVVVTVRIDAYYKDLTKQLKSMIHGSGSVDSSGVTAAMITHIERSLTGP